MSAPSTPVNIDTIIPAKWKPIVGLIGSLLTLGVPYIVSVEQYLPSPWPLVIGVVIAILTSLGIYRAPYVPDGAVLAPNTPAVAVAAQAAVTQEAVKQATVPGAYGNPWKPNQ
jgi:hypothetical protein